MMTSRAKSSVFWPNITSDIAETRAKCMDCNRMAPSQPSAPPMEPTLAEYPFQYVCADYFSFKGANYLVIVDRFSNWPIIEKSTGGAEGLVRTLRQTFATYGIPEELSTDGGTEFMATVTRQFLKNWGVAHRQSSSYHPHSNCRAELGVKVAKRLITGNTSPNGDLNRDKFHRALLQYRNTPDPATKVSPSMCVFGRAMKDFIPVHPGKYLPHKSWRSALSSREKAIKARYTRGADYWKEHTRKLPQLSIGDNVWIQNQTGSRPNKWEKTGVVVEVRQHDQYLVRIEGSNRLTLRNRKFLRKFSPLSSMKLPTLPDQKKTTSRGCSDERALPQPFLSTSAPTTMPPPPSTAQPQPSLPTAAPRTLPPPPTAQPEVTARTSSTPMDSAENQPIPRRSMRTKRAPSFFVASHTFAT